MRLLFIYFYETKGTFKEGTIITTSKKYTIEKESDDFSFTLTENSSFQDNFYGENIDLGVLIGENGTGKSVLVNSLRDGGINRKNNYSFAIFEQNGHYFKMNPPERKWERDHRIFINHEELLQDLLHSNLDLIYYTSLVDILKKDGYQGQNISNFQVTEIGCKSEQVQQIKFDDWQLYFDMGDNGVKNKYVKHLEEVRLDPTFVTKLENLVFMGSARVILIILNFTSGADQFYEFSEGLKKEILHYSRDNKKELVTKLLEKNSNEQLHVLFQGSEYFNRDDIIKIALKCLEKPDFKVIKHYIKDSYLRSSYKHLVDLDKLLLIEDLYKKFEQWLFADTSRLKNKPKVRMKFYAYLTLLKKNYNGELHDFEFSSEDSIENFIDRIDSKFDIIDDKCSRFFEMIDNKTLTTPNNQLKMPLTLFREEYKTTIKPILNSKLEPFCYELYPPLSSGQKAILFIFARMEATIKKTEKENILILLDEADLTLHPEWQRQFIDDLTIFLKEFKEKNFYVLYATHSPMVLSDVIDDRIVFLKKEGNYSVDKSIQNRKLTFGANIYDLYHDSFFMDKYMGEFAFNKINDVINMVNLYKVVKELDDTEKQEKLNDYERVYDFDKLFKSYRLYYPKDEINTKNLYEKREEIKSNIVNKKEQLKAITRFIGEPLLRNKLEDDLNSMGREFDINMIAEQLEGLSQEEIKEQLAQYSESIQMKILKKLFASGV